MSFQFILKKMNTPLKASTNEIHAVTGAFGYSGRHIAGRLLEERRDVITLTSSSPDNGGLSSRITNRPLGFNRPEQLTESLRGAKVLYNTYWVRFNHRRFDHDSAVANSRILFTAAHSAGVERVIHISITNPTLDSPLSYFRGKAQVEQSLIESGLSYAILRPAVLFGEQDILVNNIAWALRHLPVFGFFGDGSYRLCPIHVGDLASAAVRLGKTRDDVIVDAIGPQTFTYRELVEAIAGIVGVSRPLVGVPNRLGWIAGKILGALHGDVMITMDEIRGLTSGLLHVGSEPIGTTALTDWLKAHQDAVGTRYANEMARRV